MNFCGRIWSLLFADAFNELLLVIIWWDAWHEMCQARATHITWGCRPDKSHVIKSVYYTLMVIWHLLNTNTLFSKRSAHWFHPVLPVTLGRWLRDLRKLAWFSCALLLEKSVLSSDWTESVHHGIIKASNGSFGMFVNLLLGLLLVRMFSRATVAEGCSHLWALLKSVILFLAFSSRVYILTRYIFSGEIHYVVLCQRWHITKNYQPIQSKTCDSICLLSMTQD